MAYNYQQAVPTWTMDHLLMLEEKYNVVPDGIDLDKWKEIDASSDPPYCEEEPDGSLQFYNAYSGRPSRKLCDFEKDLLVDFYRYMKPGFLVPSFKDLECWRQQLNSPNMDLCDKYIRDHLSPAQKEERDESIEEWRRMMHDRFWHKERRCNCRAHLYRRSEKRFDEEPDIVEMIKSVQLGRDYRKSAKSIGTPSTPVKTIKKEPTDTPSASRGKDKKKAQQLDEDDSDFGAIKKSASKGKGRKKTQPDADDDSDFEPNKKSSSKARQSGTAINNTPTRKGKASLKAASSPDALSSNDTTSKKRKTPSKVADTTDVGVDNHIPTKKRKSTQQDFEPPAEIPTIVVTPAKKKLGNVNLVAEHPDIIEALVESVLEDMNTAAATQNKTPEEIVMEWSKQDGIDVYWKGPEVKKPSARSFVKDFTHIPNKKSSSVGKKRAKGLKAEEDDNMLRVPPTTPRRRSIVNSSLSNKPSAEARKQVAKGLEAKEDGNMLRASPTAARESSNVNDNFFGKASASSGKESAQAVKAKEDDSMLGASPTAARKSFIVKKNLFGKPSAEIHKNGAEGMKTDSVNMLGTSPTAARKSSIVNKNLFGKPSSERLQGLPTEAIESSLEDPFSSPPKNYYDRQGLNRARRYEMLQAVRAPNDLKPRLPIPQSPPPNPASFENGNIAMSSLTPNYVVAGPRMTPSRMLHFDGLTLGEQEFHSPGFSMTPSRMLHFDGLRLGEGEFYSQGPEMTPNRILHFDGLTLGEEEFHSQNRESMKYSVPSMIPSTSMMQESTVKLSGDHTRTEESKSFEKKIFDATPTTPSTSMKRKSTVKSADDHTPTKKSKLSEKKTKKKVESTANEGAEMMGASKETVRVMKSNNVTFDR